MLIKKVFKPKIIIGMAIYSAEICYVVIQKKRQDTHLLLRGRILLSRCARLLKLLSNKTHANLHLVLPFNQTIIKTLVFASPIKEKELRQLLELNSHHYFMRSIDMMTYRLECINPTKHEWRILANEKADIDKWVTLVKQRGINLQLLSNDVLAIEHYIQHQYAINDTTVYYVVLYQHSELLQMVMIRKRVHFISLVPCEYLDLNFFMQETTKFVELYESSQHFNGKLTHFICFGVDGELVRSVCNRQLFIALNTATLIDKYNLPASYVAPFGVALGC